MQQLQKGVTLRQKYSHSSSDRVWRENREKERDVGRHGGGSNLHRCSGQREVKVAAGTEISGGTTEGCAREAVVMGGMEEWRNGATIVEVHGRETTRRCRCWDTRWCAQRGRGEPHHAHLQLREWRLRTTATVTVAVQRQLRERWGDWWLRWCSCGKGREGRCCNGGGGLAAMSVFTAATVRGRGHGEAGH
ncbi:DUF899 domain-containing protein [Sesbania bispinosa]|nr:DUF899 domain-containing protein [Sesbania bispinosa]